MNRAKINIVVSMLIIICIILTISISAQNNEEKILSKANDNEIDTYIKSLKTNKGNELISIPNDIVNNKGLNDTYNVTEPGQISGFIDQFYTGGAWGSMMLIRVDGEYVYCTQPNVALGSTAVETGINGTAFEGIPQTQKRNLLIYGNFGLQKERDSGGNTDYIYAAQYLVWREMEPTKWKNIPVGHQIYDEVQELERLKNEYFTVASFSSSVESRRPTHELRWNDSKNRYEVILNDTNNVFNYKYQPIIDELNKYGFNYERNGNQLTIYTTDYKKVHDINATYVPYNKGVTRFFDGGQDLIYTISEGVGMFMHLKVIPVGDLKISKDGESPFNNVDTYSDQQGISFELRKNGEVIRSGKTNDKGELLFENVEIGEYDLVETYMPEGYNKAADRKVTITPKPGPVTEVQINNTVIKKELQLNKRGIKHDGGDETVGDVTFKVEHDFDKDGEYEDVTEVTTKSTGLIDETLLKYGNYRVTEISASLNYDPKYTEEFTISENGGEAFKLNNGEDIINHKRNLVLNINKKEEKFKKCDNPENGFVNCIVNENKADVEFYLYIEIDGDGILSEEEKRLGLVAQSNTDENGNIKFESKNFKVPEIEGLENSYKDVQKYILVENYSNDNYMKMDNIAIDFTDVVADEEHNAIINKDIVNVIKKGTVSLTKDGCEEVKLDDSDPITVSCENYTALEGIGFSVYEDANANGLLDEIEKTDGLIYDFGDYKGNGVTDESGSLNLKYFDRTKQYIISETTFPDKYFKSEDKLIKFNDKDSEVENKEVDFRNELKVQTQINVKKFLQTNKTCKEDDCFDQVKAQDGIEFELYEDTDNNGTIDSNDILMDTKQTDEKGNISFIKYLKDDGYYLLKEVSELEGYKTHSVIKVDVSKALISGQLKVIYIDVINELKTSEINLTKTQCYNEETISEHKCQISDYPSEGVDFTLYEVAEGDKRIEGPTKTTDKEGKLKFINLDPNKKYVIVETPPDHLIKGDDLTADFNNDTAYTYIDDKKVINLTTHNDLIVGEIIPYVQECTMDVVKLPTNHDGPVDITDDVIDNKCAPKRQKPVVADLYLYTDLKTCKKDDEGGNNQEKIGVTKFTTDSTGKTSIKYLDVTKKYYVRQVETSDTDLFYVAMNSRCKEVSFDNFSSAINNVVTKNTTLINRVYKGGLIVKKEECINIDKENESCSPANGVIFDLYIDGDGVQKDKDIEDQNLNGKLDEGEDILGNKEFDEFDRKIAQGITNKQTTDDGVVTDGYLEFKGLDPNADYILVEREANKGFIKSEPVTLSGSDLVPLDKIHTVGDIVMSKTARENIKNKAIENDVKVRVVDKNSEELLKDVEVEVYNSKDELVSSFTTGNNDLQDDVLYPIESIEHLPVHNNVQTRSSIIPTNYFNSRSLRNNIPTEEIESPIDNDDILTYQRVLHLPYDTYTFKMSSNNSYYNYSDVKEVSVVTNNEVQEIVVEAEHKENIVSDNVSIKSTGFVVFNVLISVLTVFSMITIYIVFKKKKLI